MSNGKNFGVTRRDFAKTGAVAGFAILTAKSGLAEANGDVLRVGLIGCGGRGTGAAMNHLTGCPNSRLVALADAFQDRLDKCRKGLEHHRDVKAQVDISDEMCFVGIDAYKKLLATDVDIILHATPPYARPQHIEAAVEAGKHIFTEKPIATDAPGVRKFIAASEKAKEKGLNIVTGLQRRHQKSYVETVEKIRNGEIGEIVSARAYWCGTLPFHFERAEGWSDLEYRLRNWYNYCWTCGDNIVEQHIHNLDVINWVMGVHPVKVFASGGRTWKPMTEEYGNIWDNFSCDFEYENGVHMISMSRHWNDSSNQVDEWVKGTKGVSDCHNLGKDDIDPYVQEHMNLDASIRGKNPYINQGVETAHSTMTAIMGRMSAYTGKELTWDEALNAKGSIVPEDLDFAKAYPMDPIPVPGKESQEKIL